MKFIAFTVKGLEKVAADEIQERFYDAEILSIEDKRVIFRSHESLEKIASLTTVDDVGILLTESSDSSDLPSIIETLSATDFYKARELFSGFRKIPPMQFSLTISAVGVKGYSQEDILKEGKKRISEKYKWTYLERDHTVFDIRLFIDHSYVSLSVRLTSESLHHRAYKVESQEGSLRPTIASAMVRLATDGESGLKVVDTFCGSGTILCEALLAENQIYGSDIDPDAVAITNLNLHQIDDVPADRVKIQNAMSTKWPDRAFDVAISNLPWNKQIAVSSITDLYIRTLLEYKRILKENNTICVLVSKPELFIKHAKATFPKASIKSIKISFTGQTPTIVLMKNTVYNDSYDFI